jgi:tRNA-specific 2-thiouridylase
MATGHYARVVETQNGYELHSAQDIGKDQSYFLFEMTQDQLSAVEFPLGEMTKGDVRDLARKARLSVAEKGESMEICFVSSGIQEFIEEQVVDNPSRFPSAPQAEASEIVDKDGNLLARGDPYYRYTVGQRRGLGVSSSERLYVLGVESEQNRVVVGTGAELESRGLVGERLHWIGPAPAGEIEATVKIRSRHPGVRAQIRPLADSRVEVEFDVPQRGVAPGQAAVFYQGSRVLGGCWISSSLESASQPRQ